MPDPGRPSRCKICYTLFRPAGANPAPGADGHAQPRLGRLAHDDAASFEKWLKRGYGVLSFDQRGFGESGGKARVENPDFEGHDVRALVDLRRASAWVKQDGPGDPRLGAIGGSYGGGYQFVGAFEELALQGSRSSTRSLPRSPGATSTEPRAQGVVRTEWALALSAAALPRRCPGRLPGARRGSRDRPLARRPLPVPGHPDMDAFFEKNGPPWQVSQGRKLDIPVLFGQGITDTLFNAPAGAGELAQGDHRAARRKSIFVGYNGGHVLPAGYPQAVTSPATRAASSSPAATSRTSTIRFFDEQLKHETTASRATAGTTSRRPATRAGPSSSSPPNKTFPVGTVATTQTGGAALAFKVAEGTDRSPARRTSTAR